jgi:predicted ATP-dependent endonuclease of OLD family
VKHDRESATAVTVKAHFDRVGVVSELGAKPSDLLNANGIIWVEGPSDRIYVNRWIELVSNGELKEGRDYTCASYGGALLAAAQFTTPEAADAELNNLLRINSNVVVICDSDRTEPKAALKERIIRIQDEVKRIPGGVLWITEAKEIENYLPVDALKKFHPDTSRAPDQFERFFPGTGKASFWEEQFKLKSYDKMELATLVATHLTQENLSDRFDWLENVSKIVEAVRGWNH